MSSQTPIRFGSEGIRGVVGEYPLDAPSLLRIGRAIGRWNQRQDHRQTEDRDHHAPALIGHDTRANCTQVLQALATGLMAEGITVFNGGVITSAGLVHALRGGSFEVGVMISGGDLPADHNGITLFGWGGVPLLPEDEAAIEAQIEQLAGDRASRRSTPFKRYSLLPASDVHDKYLSRLTAWAAPDALNGLRVVVDGGFGTAHKLAPDALTQVGASVISLNDAPDGTNIALNAGAGHVQHDPSRLLAAIHEHHADVGLAFDALGERAVFVTPEGALLTGEHVTGILALEMQAAGSLPFDSVVASEDGHAVLAARLMAHGVQVVAAPPGLRSLLATMHAQGLRLGATGNGSVIVLNDDHTYADGLYVALLILWLVAQDKQHGGPTLHQRAAPFSA